MPTHAENKLARRQALMAAARDLYAAQGVENTTMDDVARAAGCTRRTLYAYFASWEDLMSQIYLDNLTRRWHRQRDAMSAGANGLECIQIWANTYYEFARVNPEAVHLEMFRDYRGIAPSDHDQDLRRRYESVMDPLVAEMVAVFENGQADGSIRRDLDAMTSLSHLAFSLRAVMNRVLSSADTLGGFNTDDFVTSYIEFFIDGISIPQEVRS